MSTTMVREVFEMKEEKVAEREPNKFGLPSEIGTDNTFKRAIVWKNVFGFIVLHLGALYGLYLTIMDLKWTTVLYLGAVVFLTGEGVTAGAHRLFSHRAYKAAFPLKIVLLIFQTMSGQNCLYIWVRDHRQHHKFSDTDADPHNAKRGFFFAHMGWLMSKKHPLVKLKGKTVDMSDLEADPWIMLQKKYYKTLYFVFALIIPVSIPVYFWDETVWNSFFSVYFLRYVFILHITWTVNSIAHFYGNKPFDKNIIPVENKFVSLWTGGEGWHNYHHAFPWDYKAGEFGSSLNATKNVIELMAYMGMAYDLKEATVSMVQRRVQRTGDGSHEIYKIKDSNDNKYCDKRRINETSDEFEMQYKSLPTRG